MAFCPNCGAQAPGSFCPNCGVQVRGAAGATPGGGFSAGAPVASAPGLTENVAGALCYLFGMVTGIIFLLIAPYSQNRTVRFHAFQSIFFNVGWIAFCMLWAMVGVVTHGVGLLMTPLLGLLFFLLWLYLMFSAYNNKKVKLPVIGDLAEKQA